MLRHRLKFDRETTEFLRKCHNQPQPRITEGQLLLRRGVRAAIDISDGLVQDLSHLCKASGVGARIIGDKIPIHPVIKAAFPADCLNFALAGGEDYELIFTAPSDVIKDTKDEIGCPVSVIGEILKDKPGQVELVDMQGNALDWNKKGGWNHFASRDEHGNR